MPRLLHVKQFQMQGVDSNSVIWLVSVSMGEAVRRTEKGDVELDLIMDATDANGVFFLSIALLNEEFSISPAAFLWPDRKDLGSDLCFHVLREMSGYY